MIDINKKYHTRDGREVRIYATDGLGPCRVHGAIFEGSRYWRIETWWDDGQLLGTMQSDSDLIEVRPRHKWTAWLNIYGPESFTSHISREQAEDEQDVNRIACIKVELDFEEGQGL